MKAIQVQSEPLEGKSSSFFLPIRNSWAGLLRRIDKVFPAYSVVYVTVAPNPSQQDLTRLLEHINKLLQEGSPVIEIRWM